MRATLDMFSGRPNPTWRLTTPEAGEMRQRVAGIELAPVAFQVPRLGFRGLVIEEDLAGEVVPSPIPQQIRLAAPTAQEAGPSFAVPKRSAPAWDVEVECARWLVESAVDRIGEEVTRAISEHLGSPPPAPSPSGPAADRAPNRAGAAAATAAAGPEAGEDRTLVDSLAPALCRPFLSPMRLQLWNQPAIQPYNNCYNYATNFVSGTLAQPGRRAGRMYSHFSCEEVLAAARRDGLQTSCNGDPRVVALGIWPGLDFHWWRLHPAGFWAHKIGWWPAQNTDNSGRILGNGLTPANCDRGLYTQFCGYFFAPLSMWVT